MKAGVGKLGKCPNQQFFAFSNYEYSDSRNKISRILNSRAFYEKILSVEALMLEGRDTVCSNGDL